MDIRNKTPSFSDEDADVVPRPWEGPGSFRRDCDPHRGPLLVTLAFASVLCGFFAPLLIPAIPGVILASVGCRMAAGDLGKMERGLLDRLGKEDTEVALHQFRVGLTLNLLFLFFWAAFMYILVYVGP